MLKTKAILGIFPGTKAAYILVYDKSTGRYLSMINLEYYPDIKDFELQVLLHGYKILGKNLYKTSEDVLEAYDLESI